MTRNAKEWWKSKKHIYVIGYPRSGTTWVLRALAQALDCPALGPWHGHDQQPLSPDFEGLDRESNYVVRRVHLSPAAKQRLHTDHETVAVITSVRDPRDVAVSAWYHFTFPKTEEGLTRCVRQLCGLELGAPLIADSWGGQSRHGWAGFVEDWLAEDVPLIRYEDHVAHPVSELRRIIDEIGFEVDVESIIEAAEDNLFHNRPRDRLMRRGRIGTWHENLTPDMVETIENHCGDVMERLGYERLLRNCESE